MNFTEGEILLINKPLHWTSFQIVAKVRKTICQHLGIKKLKVGHAGTLDPLATGVMIICTGKKTKEIENYQYQTKEYIATIKLGSTTPSFDLETNVDNEYSTDHLTDELITNTINGFIGRIEQIPPQYSAVKINGVRAYEHARAGNIVELKPKVLVIDEIEILKLTQPIIKIRIVCSKGTYIRALARDIGETLKCGAHLIGLERTKIGSFSLKDCIDIIDIDNIVNN